MTLDVEGITFGYGSSNHNVLDGIELSIRDREIFTLLGGSGSGKTTLLNIIAGFITPKTGSVILDGKDITDQVPEKRRIGIVFQDYALFPHMSVGGNVGFGPRSRGTSRKETRKVTAEMLDLVDLSGYENRSASELSGGEKQRVALARTLAVKPEVILLDEPLSALDASLRESLRRDLKRILREQRVKVLYVTHDQSEALSLSDRIGYLDRGRIIEQGPPNRIYWGPRKKETASFMGFVNSVAVKGNENGYLKTVHGRIPWNGKKTPIEMMFRPESASSKGGEGLIVKGNVKGTEYRGRDQLLDIRAGGDLFRVFLPHESSYKIDETIVILVPFSNLIPVYH